MKQLNQLTVVIAQTLCAAIVILLAVGPTSGQEKEAQRAKLVVQTGHTDAAQSISFSPDGRYFASSNQLVTKLWNVTTGQEIRALPGGWAMFSPDDKTMATVIGSLIRLWDWRTGQQLQDIQADLIFAMAFSPKGDVVATVSPIANTIKLWDVKSGRQLRVLAGHTGMIQSAIFSPDGRTLASASVDKTLKLWDWQTGEQLRTIEAWISLGHRSNSMAFSPDAKMIAGNVLAGKLTFWDVKTGQKLREVEGFAMPGADLVAFRQGGKTLAALSNDLVSFGRTVPDPRKSVRANPMRSYIKLIDVATGQELQRIHFDNEKAQVTSFQFSPDEKTLAILGADRNPKFLDPATGRELRTLAGYAEQVTAVGSSADSSLLATGNAAGSVKLWDLQKGRQIRSLDGHDSPVKEIVFSQDKQILISATAQAINLWNIETGEQLKSLLISDPTTQKQVEAVVPSFYQQTRYVTFIGDGKFALTRGENGTLNIQEADKFEPLVSLISLNENDWVVVTPEGLFDASPGARKLMHYVTGLEPIQLEQMKDAYYAPGLLQNILKGNPLPKVELFSSGDLFPLAEYQQSGPASLSVKLTNRGGGIGPVQVLINQKECGEDPLPPNFDPRQPSVTLRIDLAKCGLLIPGKQNVVEVVTRNAAGSLNSRGSSRGVEIVGVFEGPAQVSTPQIYAIVAGVSDYTGNDLDLSYAAKDAEDFAKAFDVGASKLFGADRVHLRVLTSNGAKSNLAFSSNDAKILTATKADITKAFEEFKKASANDIFIVYLAGHGASLNLNRSSSLAGADTYLYLTQEATTTRLEVLSDKKARDAMTISSDELAELMKRNKALKQVLILDTCAAGAASTSLVSQRDLPSDQIKAIERLQDRIGFFVLMGAAADKVSYEATQYHQGLLTYSLLQGMRGAKLRDEKFADINMLINYAQDTVPSLAKNIGGIQRPIVIMPERLGMMGESGSFDIGMFTTVEIAKMPKQTLPRTFIVRPTLIEVNENYDKLGLTPLLRQAFRDVESSLAFIDADEMIDAVKLSGSYAIKGDDVTVTLRLTRNNVPVGKTLTVGGKVADKKLIVEKIVTGIMQTELSK